TSMPIVKQPKQTKLTLKAVQKFFKTLCLNLPTSVIWRSKARLLAYINEHMSAQSPRIFLGDNSPKCDGHFT
ncbi:MAG: hypothetical protein EBY22_16410, partial [Gammaproteobacteria bacterium]|nr:hypothetical protein [Gammaproteobacteria bacterium]